MPKELYAVGIAVTGFGLAVAWSVFPWLPIAIAVAGVMLAGAAFLSGMAIISRPAVMLAHDHKDRNIKRLELRFNAQIAGHKLDELTTPEENNKSTTTTTDQALINFCLEIMTNAAGEGGALPAYNPANPSLAPYIRLMRKPDGQEYPNGGAIHHSTKYYLGILRRRYEASPAGRLAAQRAAFDSIPVNGRVVAEAQLPVKRGPGRPRKVRE